MTESDAKKIETQKPGEKKPTPHLQRALSLLQTGPRGMMLRFVDQFQRKRSGVPVWKLSEVAPSLFVGGQHSARGWQAMQDAGITAVLNMRESHHDDVAKGIGGLTHLHLPTRDNTPPTLEALEEAAKFIRQQLDTGGQVYVHCGVGVGRAPCAAAAYLISNGMSAREAVKQMRGVRPFIHLTPGQFRQLELFEQMQRAAASTETALALTPDADAETAAEPQEETS